jgi:hypothetical protein
MRCINANPPNQTPDQALQRTVTTESPIDHNKLIAAAAKEALSPLGLKRDGKTRLWYDDHGWWCIVVEFQPSSWSKGTYLNVGTSWLLFEKAHWTFDVGYREEGFSPARARQQFSDALSRIVAHASERVQAYRGTFATIQSAHRHYQSTELRSHWDYYYAALIAALAGELPTARQHFDSLLSQPRRYQWEHGLYYRALDLSRLLDCRRHFLDSVRGIVLRTRTQLLLDDRDSGKLGLPDDVT